MTKLVRAVGPFAGILVLALLALVFIGHLAASRSEPVISHGYWYHVPKTLELEGMDTFTSTGYSPNKLQWKILTYGFTQCPDICPMTLTTLVRAISNLESSMSIELALLFYTLDPKTDTPDRLAQYLSYFTATHLVLRPKTESAALQFETNLGIEVTRENLGGRSRIGHNANIYLINPKGQVQAVLTPDLTTLGPKLLSQTQLIEGITAVIRRYRVDEK